MDLDQLISDPKLVRLLMRIGYFSAWNGLHSDAIAIFDGVRAIRPESEMPAIGAAVVALISGHPEKAVEVLKEEALQKNPDSEFARAHLGCALRMSGLENEGCALLKEITENATDANARTIASNLLEMDYSEIGKRISIL